MKLAVIKKEIRNILIIYSSTWLFSFLAVTILLYINQNNLKEAATSFFEFLSNPSFLLAIHILFGIVLLLFVIIRYFVRLYKKRGRKIALKQFAFRLLSPALLVFIAFKTLVFANSYEDYDFDWIDTAMNNSGKSKNLCKIDAKHRGMSVFGWGRNRNTQNTTKLINPLIRANVEWIAIVPFIGQESETALTVRRPISINANWSRRDSVYIRSINATHSKGLHVQLKPHIWISNGWRSNINLNSDEEWNTWFNSYKNYILHYARMAEDTGVELFCIGTELKTSIKQQPEAWKNLITEVRSIYSGKLTYAANWHDEYEYIDFWPLLDYIGIQAYFPLTENKSPDLETIEKGWAKHIIKLEELHKTYKKPILFTEVGYRSDVSATIKPWEWDSALSVLHKKKSDQTQQLAFEALFRQLWHKEWFAGLYVWEWDHRSTEAGAANNLNFSPRFKPAENVIAKWFGKPIEKKD